MNLKEFEGKKVLVTGGTRSFGKGFAERFLEYGANVTITGRKENGNTILLKDIGAPSKLCSSLGIDKQSGSLFCGQVRWATFGAVNKENAQPHEVSCTIHLYGAHNGNITNNTQLKSWLLDKKHKRAEFISKIKESEYTFRITF